MTLGIPIHGYHIPWYTPFDEQTDQYKRTSQHQKFVSEITNQQVQCLLKGHQCFQPYVAMIDWIDCTIHNPHLLYKRPWLVWLFQSFHKKKDLNVCYPSPC